VSLTHLKESMHSQLFRHLVYFVSKSHNCDHRSTTSKCSATDHIWHWVELTFSSFHTDYPTAAQEAKNISKIPVQKCDEWNISYTH